MKAQVACLFLATVFTGFFALGWSEEVLTLTADNFDSVIAENDLVVVEFYAPWCGHCKSLAPEYEKAAAALKGYEPKIVLAKVDADEAKNKPLASKYGVRGFPTLKIFRKGNDEPQEFQGPREADGIVSYMKKQAGPASVELTSKSQAKAFFDENDVVTVGVFSALGSPEATTFKEVAQALRSDYVFAHTTDASLLPSVGTDVPSAPVVRLFKNFDEEFNDFTDFDGDLKAFVEEKSWPLVVEMSKEPASRPALMKAFNDDKPKVLLFYEDGEGSEEIKKALNVYALQSTAFKYIYGSAKENDNAIQYFGLQMTDVPVLIVHDNKKDTKFVLPKATPERLSSWLGEVETGKVERTIKSEPIPEENDGPVKVLVAKNFDDIVTNSGKNVLIEFYAPWCGHCKSLAPIYEEVGKDFAGDDEVVIAKMDATANDVPSSDFAVKGFPTLFFRAASGEVISYDGDRSKKDLVSFVKKHKTSVEEDSIKDEL